MSDTVRITFDGRELEGSIEAAELELTMTDFTAPTIESAVTGLIKRNRGIAPVAIEVNPEDLRIELGSLHSTFVELAMAPLGAVMVVRDVELRASVHVPRKGVRAWYRCSRCGGGGVLRDGDRAVRSVWLPGQRCPECDGSGESRMP